MRTTPTTSAFSRAYGPGQVEAMPDIKRVELERDNDQGVHEVKQGERLEPVEPAPPGSDKAETDKRKRQEKEEFERATTPFPGG